MPLEDLLALTSADGSGRPLFAPGQGSKCAGKSYDTCSINGDCCWFHPLPSTPEPSECREQGNCVPAAFNPEAGTMPPPNPLSPLLDQKDPGSFSPSSVSE